MNHDARIDSFWEEVNIADQNKVTYLLEMFERGVQQNDMDTLEFVVDVAFKIENLEIRASALNHLLLLDGHEASNDNQRIASSCSSIKRRNYC